MLLILILSIVPQLTVAKEFLDDCPIKKGQRLDHYQVINVLRDFYNDINFVQASTESGGPPNFDEVVEEMRNLDNSIPQWQHLVHGMELYAAGDLHQVLSYLRNTVNDVVQLSKTQESYDFYFRAEMSRMGRKTLSALDYITYAAEARMHATGISLNELERLEGLILFQRIIDFNQDVDELYGLSRGQSLVLLGQFHPNFKDKMDPFEDMRPVESYKQSKSNRRIFPAISRREIGNPSQEPWTAVLEMLDHWHVNPVGDILNVRSVPKTSVEDILCEFAQKLAILVPETRYVGETDYSSTIDQVRGIHAGFAEELNILVAPGLFRNRQDNFIYNLGHLERRVAIEAPNHLETLQTYINYFASEFFRNDDCSTSTLADARLQKIKTIRRSKRGIPLDKLFELEGRILIKYVRCFYYRLQSIYRVTGYESEQELQAKRDQLGKCDNYIPVDF